MVLLPFIQDLTNLVTCKLTRRNTCRLNVIKQLIGTNWPHLRHLEFLDLLKDFLLPHKGTLESFSLVGRFQCFPKEKWYVARDRQHLAERIVSQISPKEYQFDYSFDSVSLQGEARLTTKASQSHHSTAGW